MVVNSGLKRNTLRAVGSLFCLRTGTGKYVMIIKCQNIQISYFYSCIKAVFDNREGAVIIRLKLHVHQQAVREGRPQGKRALVGRRQKLLCHLSHLSQHIWWCLKYHWLIETSAPLVGPHRWIMSQKLRVLEQSPDFVYGELLYFEQ